MPEVPVVQTPPTGEAPKASTVETPPESGKETPPESGKETPKAQEVAPPATPEVPTDPAAIAKLNAELARLKTALSSRDRELKTLKSGKAPETPPPTPPAAPAAHPALQGLETRQDGSVKYKGVWVSPEFAIDQWDRAEELRTTKERAQADDESRRQAEQEELENGVYRNAEEYTRNLAKQAFPTLPPESLENLEDYIVLMASFEFQRDLRDGAELSGELIDKAARAGIVKATQLFASLGIEQVKGNLEFAAKNKTSLEGPPGVPKPVDTSKLSRSERNRVIAERVRVAESMRPK